MACCGVPLGAACSVPLLALLLMMEVLPTDAASAAATDAVMRGCRVRYASHCKIHHLQYRPPHF